ncbi:MAG: hypothetical protein ACLQU5_08130 [Isosphaeraceae bacterium]
MARVFPETQPAVSPLMLDPESELDPRRPEPRRFAALIVITAAVALALGVMLRQSSMIGANDISRWCTVWSLLGRGSYITDECPWLVDTQDKVYRVSKSENAGPEPVKHYYSSKPALLSTLIAGLLYSARRLTGIPLDRVVLQEREERWVQKVDESAPYKVKGVLEKPKDPVKWPAHVFYFKAVLLLLNILPFCLFLILYSRVLDRYAGNDWAWFFSLVAAALGTYLLPFTQILNNHAVAAFSAFFALYHFLRIWDEGMLSRWRFAAVGFGAAFTAVNELPALSFLGLIAGLLLRHPRQTLLCLVPAALVPIAASVAAQHAAVGELKLVYTEFGTESYLWEGSLWKTPLELDAFNLPWFDPQEAARRGIAGESHGLYLFHSDAGASRILVAHADLLFLACRIGTAPGPRRRADGRGRRDDDSPDHRAAGLLHLDPVGPKLRGLNPGPALVFLADSVLAAGAAEGGRNGPVPGLGPLAEPAGSLGLPHLGRLRAVQSLDAPLDPRCP